MWLCQMVYWIDERIERRGWRYEGRSCCVEGKVIRIAEYLSADFLRLTQMNRLGVCVAGNVRSLCLCAGGADRQPTITSPVGRYCHALEELQIVDFRI